MLDFAIFAVTFLLALVGAVLYLYPGAGLREGLRILPRLPLGDRTRMSDVDCVATLLAQIPAGPAPLRAGLTLSGTQYHSPSAALLAAAASPSLLFSSPHWTPSARDDDG
ncbi:hypothetical protein P7K49_013775 [Saguinus oedipus]|uniref:Uncharacterized protein n=1 Tax=Saguinus oedipus TaxID=9490 RepID=A0ABQ9VHE6_SAGOE|nr:hypothetical protein P7K49_013775 [Saguinus oedipus]